MDKFSADELDEPLDRGKQSLFYDRIRRSSLSMTLLKNQRRLDVCYSRICDRKDSWIVPK